MTNKVVVTYSMTTEFGYRGDKRHILGGWWTEENYKLDKPKDSIYQVEIDLDDLKSDGSDNYIREFTHIITEDYKVKTNQGDK